MAVTSRNRVICWSVNVEQNKDERGCCCGLFNLCAKCCFPNLCAANTDYTAVLNTAVFDLTKIVQVTQKLSSTALCCCFCVSFECSVEVCFEEFEFTESNFVSTRSKKSFFNTLQSVLSSGVVAVENIFGISRQDRIIRIVSSTADKVHNEDMFYVLDDLTKLYSDVISSLPAHILPDVFVNTFKTDIEGGKFTTVDKIPGTIVVADNCDVTFPQQWLTLVQGEQIIATHGEKYRLTCTDWGLSILTCGYYYCTRIRALKRLRYGVVLTNKRVIIAEIDQVAGK